MIWEIILYYIILYYIIKMLENNKYFLIALTNEEILLDDCWLLNILFFSVNFKLHKVKFYMILLKQFLIPKLEYIVFN